MNSGGPKRFFLIWNWRKKLYKTVLSSSEPTTVLYFNAPHKKTQPSCEWLVETQASATVLANETWRDVYRGRFLAEIFFLFKWYLQKWTFPFSASGCYKLEDIWYMAAVWEWQLGVCEYVQLRHIIICI